MRISEWSSAVCSADNPRPDRRRGTDFERFHAVRVRPDRRSRTIAPNVELSVRDGSSHRPGSDAGARRARCVAAAGHCARAVRSEEQTSELQSLMRISYAVFSLKKKIKNKQ